MPADGGVGGDCSQGCGTAWVSWVVVVVQLVLFGCRTKTVIVSAPPPQHELVKEVVRALIGEIFKI